MKFLIHLILAIFLISTAQIAFADVNNGYVEVGDTTSHAMPVPPADGHVKENFSFSQYNFGSPDGGCRYESAYRS